MTVLRYLDTTFIKNGLECLARYRIHPLVGFFLDMSRYRVAHHIAERSFGATKLSSICQDYTVNGGPARKPLLIPFKDRNNAGVLGFFRNGNLAGSWAPSSVRSEDSRTSLTDADGHYCYPDDPGAFLTERLGGFRPQMWAMAAFYLRDAEFAFDGSREPTAKDLVDIFRKLYGLEAITVFDDSTEDTPANVFQTVQDIATPPSQDGEHVDLDNGLSAIIHPRSRRPKVIASDIVEGIENPRDSDLESAAERMMQDFGGVILVGPPGTSKSYTAQSIADHMTDSDASRQFYTQFHSSYQYEDFVEGYRPTSDGGFERREGIFLQACDAARNINDGFVVLVIDEISRADVGRVFGEALTYIEPTKRGMSFRLPSGAATSVPKNLMVVATMNSLDRGANDIDEAFGRRFAFIEVPPDPNRLAAVLPKDADSDVLTRIRRWMESDLKIASEFPRAAVGHAFFSGVKTRFDANRRWHYQIERYLSHALMGQPEVFSTLQDEWNREFPQDDAER